MPRTTLAREAPAGAGAVPVVVEFGGDGERAGSFAAVAGEDAFDDGELGRLDGEVVLVVEAQPVGDGAAGPAAAGGLAFHAGDDPVDDGGPFELGEHPEELNEHPPGGGGGVDGFGGRAEGDPDAFEFFEETDEDLEGAGEAVDAVDEEDVVAAEAGVA